MHTISECLGKNLNWLHNTALGLCEPMGESPIGGKIENQYQNTMLISSIKNDHIHNDIL